MTQLSLPDRLEPRRRATWRNVFGNQRVDPLAICTPRSLDDLVLLVAEAERHGTTVRAVGSGHSWSDAALGTGLVALPQGLSGMLDLDEDELRSHPEHLVRCGSGTRLRTLNAALDRRGLALPNMGGYDAQTVAGVISTSTHGSGIEFGPLSDLVRSLDLVGAGGTVYRVEPTHGPTDAAAWRARHPEPGFRLVQDDHWFRAVKVGVGSLGLAHSAMLEVEPSYLLTERRALTTWEAERELIADRLAKHRHYELLLSPHARHDRHACMVTTRDRAAERRPWWSSRSRRNVLAEALSSLPGIGRALDLLANAAPRLTPLFTDLTVRGLADDEYTHKSFKVLDIGAANSLPAYSAEIGVRIDHDAGTHVEAVDRVLAIADEHRALGSIYHTGPIALRFVKASDAYLSMMEGRPTMMIELIQLERTEGGYELLAAYEDALYELGGRPHWGQVNTLPAGHGLIERLYPRYGDWLAVHAQLNASGVFDSPFTKRVGISAP